MNTSQDGTAGGGWPLVFEAGGGSCFGWLHPASTSAPRRGTGVVLCRPLGYEAVCCYRAYLDIAQTLARAGFDVLRFDYHGTGDSAGDDADPGRVEAWTASVVEAARELKRRTGTAQTALFGVRMGATLAVAAAARMGGVDSLVLWAACTTGRAYARELRAANASRGGAARADGSLEALGYLYTAATLRELALLDCERPAVPPALRVLSLGRDDVQAEGPLPGAYRALGVTVTHEVLPGFAALMTAEPHEAVLDPLALRRITDWLSAAHPPSAPMAQARADLPAAPSFTVGPVRERALGFGGGRALFGLLSEPLEPSASRQRLDTAVLLVNVGGNYRVGPNRIYVHTARALAQAGHRVLRFDLPGIGDTPSTAGTSVRSLYARDSTADVRAAIDALAALGSRRFYLLGICSGAYVAFQTALAEPRVNGQVLMNTRLLEWNEGMADDWQGAMQQYYKSTDYYLHSLFKPAVYRRLLMGQVDVRGISRRLWRVLEARLARWFSLALRRTPRGDGLLAKMRRLTAAGVDTLMIGAAEDDGRDYVESHFGRAGSRLRGDPNFRTVLVEGTDHTFSDTRSRDLVIATVRDHLERRLAPVETPMPLPSGQLGASLAGPAI